MDKSVLITGASTGIGKACAIYLQNHGFKVFAGVRKEEDATSLRETNSHLTPVILDVTKQEQIQQVVEKIAAENEQSLFGLVNNAGIGLFGPLETFPMKDIQRVVATNFVGLVAVTQACLPLLRKSRGRIVNMSSIAGRVAFPGSSVYSGTKFAIEAMSDSLRLELLHLGISVSVIEPGVIATPIWDKTGEDTQNNVAVSQEAKNYDNLIRRYQKIYSDAKGEPPESVAKAVHHALSHKKPRPRYLIGKDAQKIVKAAALPTWLRDWALRKEFGI